MKKINKGPEPSGLTQLRTHSPTGTWSAFTQNITSKKALQQQLRMDQGGLCAYCEINLTVATESNEADFRVEHFHPKSDTSTSHNWALDWNNLFACCHGGSNPNVTSASERFEPVSPDRTCDVLKGYTNLDAVILNPLQVPATPSTFKFLRTSGAIKVNSTVSISQQKAQDTIDKLNLNSPRLKRMRKKSLDHLNRKIAHLLANGETLPDAKTKMAKTILRKDSAQCWPAFFSAIRSHLGQEAEIHLQKQQYSG